jgi:SAM-dependent methyltransferase
MEKNCIICENKNLQELFFANNQELSRYGLRSSESSENQSPLMTLDIRRCDNCGLVFNADFKYDLVDYESEEIQEARGFSPKYKKFMDESSLELNNLIDLNGKKILEIGCGDGYFLSAFSEKSICMGYEPSPERNIAIKRGISVLGHYFDWTESVDLKCDFVIMRQVLEHLPDPLSMIKAIKNVLMKSNEYGYLYIEVPNSNKTLESLRFADFYYEHCLYFTTGSLVNLLEKSGFYVISCKEVFDGEVLSIIARCNKIEISRQNFGEAVTNAVNNINRLTQSGLKVVGWGSSGNGPSFLNLCKINSDLVRYVIDSDKRKQGKTIGGTNQIVVPPDILIENPSDVVIIFSQFHKADIFSEIKNKYSSVKYVLTIEEICQKNLPIDIEAENLK